MNVASNNSFYPRLIAFDLDGTLLQSNRRVSARTLKALEHLHAKGIHLVICTGRPARTAKPIIESLGLGALAALYNGAVIYNLETDKPLKYFDLNKALALHSIRTMKQAIPEAMAAMETQAGWYTDPDYYTFRKLNSELVVEPTGIGELGAFMNTPIIKLLFRHPALESHLLAEALSDVKVHCTWSFPTLLEVSALGVTKENALVWIANELKVSAQEVAAFGDQHNDKEMLAWAGYGVAMGNAVAEAKAAADYVTKSNDEDGVAEVLERWL